ncbi:GNL3L/Grn1 putative GTPase-domain-containing protein [Lactarius deliciosus]|nr:GNL3L/Grn1 putative GTPase-domain-containing protein [Lactarius deliciosus]
MPRIRKRTSRRGTTARRAKIQDKVAESRKKAKKAAKKDVTWKSKKSKDPGIPNNFPYKDQILAEIAEERRQALEAKARRKEEKKVLRAQQKNAALGADGEHGSDDEENAENNEGGFDGVATFDGRAKAPPSKSKKSAGGAHGTEDGVPPLLMNPELPHLTAVLDKADVVIEILDARDPLAHRSRALEAQVSLKAGRRLLLVLNKIDGCPRESTAAWAAHLRAEHPTLLFRAASAFLPPTVKYDSTKGKGKEKEPSDDAWGLDAVNTLLGRWAHEKAGDGPLHVAVVGLTNSGKSAFVNSLARRTTLDVYAPSSSTHNSPTTTPHALEVTLELDGKPVDWPGNPPNDASPEDRVRHRAQDVLLRNKGRIDHLKDPIPAVSYIVSRAETEDLMVRYCLPAFAKGDADAFLMGVARANALVKKGGDPDLVGAARLVLRDWSTGKLPRYAVPPPIAQQADGDPSLATIYADDAALLERLVPRKELRRSRDVVRLSAGQLDERALALEAPWFGSAATAGSESDEDGEMEASDAGLDDDGDENAESDAQASVRDEDGSDGDPDAIEAVDTWHVDADGNEDEGTPTTTTPRSSPARKRKLPPSSSSTKRPVDPARPNKKVTFATTVASVNGAAKTSSKGRRALRQAPESTKVVSAAAASTNGSKKSKIGPARAPPAATARRTGPIKPAANAPTAVQKRKNQAAAAASEEGAYDFSKFF